MCRSICLALLAFSVSAVVAGRMDYLKYVVPEDLEDGVTYEFDLYSRVLTRIEATNCTEPGPICDGCTKVYECIQIGNGFIIMPLDDCPKDTSCLQATGKCTTNHNPECDEQIFGYRFICRQTGLFPDAFNCQKYHMCVPGNTNGVEPTPITMKCDKEFYYDSRTTLCRKKFVNSDCPDPAPVCTSSGQAGVLAANPTLYFICLRESGSTSYFPQIFSCANNMEYDATKKLCVDPTPVPAAGPDGKCTSVGNFYDPASCFNTYECAEVGVAPVQKACPSKTHFDLVTRTCQDFTCSDLDK